MFQITLTPDDFEQGRIGLNTQGNLEINSTAYFFAENQGNYLLTKERVHLLPNQRIRSISVESNTGNAFRARVTYMKDDTSWNYASVVGFQLVENDFSGLPNGEYAYITISYAPSASAISPSDITSVTLNISDEPLYFCRWTITKNGTPANNDCVWMSEFVPMNRFGDPVKVVDYRCNLGDFPSGWSSENILNIFNGSPNDRYTAPYYNGNCTITMAVFEPVENYAWYTSNYYAHNRDPVSWTVETSIDGENWTLLDAVNDFPDPGGASKLAYSTLKSWEMGDNGYPKPRFVISPPDVPNTNRAFWRITPGVNDGYPYTGWMPMDEPGGAFLNASKLSRVVIPESVRIIGALAFSGTALRSVILPEECTYSATSFPEECEISTSGSSGEYGQLYDCTGAAVLDSEGARIYVRRNNDG